MNTIWGKYSADIFKQIAGRSGNGLKKRECKKGAVASCNALFLFTIGCRRWICALK